MRIPKETEDARKDTEKSDREPIRSTYLSRHFKKVDITVISIIYRKSK